MFLDVEQVIPIERLEKSLETESIYIANYSLLCYYLTKR